MIYYCLCSQESLLSDLEDPMECKGSKSGQMHAKNVPYIISLALFLAFDFEFDYVTFRALTILSVFCYNLLFDLLFCLGPCPMVLRIYSPLFT